MEQADMTSRFAVVLETSIMKSLTSQEGLLGICIVDGGNAETKIVSASVDLNLLIGDTPTSPSGIGRLDAVLTLNEELEAIKHIKDAALSLNKKLDPEYFPEGIRPISPRLCGGFQIRMTSFGLDIRFTKTRAKLLGFRPGTKLQIGVDAYGNLHLFQSTNGVALLESMEDPNFLITDSEFRNLPLEWCMEQTSWLDTEFSYGGESLSFVKPRLATPPPLEGNFSARKPRTRRVVPRGLISTVILADLGLIWVTALTLSLLL